MKRLILLFLLLQGLSAFPQDNQQITLDWLKKKNIVLNQLPLADPATLNYTCDSTLFLKHRNGDTTIIWAHGVQIPLDTQEIKSFINRDTYGKTSYLRAVYPTGKVNGVRLMPYTFCSRQDSLFELERFYSIPLDSLLHLLNLQYANFDKQAKVDSIEELIQATSYEQFKLIYHPDIFQNNVYEGNANQDKISLETIWECGDKRYFKLEILDGYSHYNRKYTYIFDETYKWLKYEGCNQAGLDCLTPQNIVEQH